MRRVRVVVGCFVIALSTAAVLTVGIRGGLSRMNLVVCAFFVATIYAGWQLVRGSWKNEREHEAKLTALLDKERSERTGGADPGNEPGK